MSGANIALIAVAVIAILGSAGAFAVAFRRSEKEDAPDPTSGVSAETLRADRSMAGVRVEPVAAEEPDEADAAEEPEESEEPEIDLEPEPDSDAVHVVSTQRVMEVTPEESGVSRRQFFNRAITVTFGSFMALMGINSLAFFWPKLSGGFGADIDAGPISDLETKVFASDGSILPLFVPEARAYLVPAPSTLSEQFDGRSVEVGGLMALFQRCVHLGCRVPWCAPSQGFECPCHGSKYNSIGEYFAGPAPRNLDRFVVELQGSNFIIKTGTIIETPRAPLRSVEYPQGPSCIGAIAAGEE